MSSTNRGYSRHESDYYRTPPKAIKDFLGCFLGVLQEQNHWLSARPDKVLWYDPCAGGDATHAMAYPSVIENELGAIVGTNDIRPDSPAETHEEYTKCNISPEQDIIITNPPFYQAEEIITKALQDVNTGGFVIMLLRLNFLGSEKRKKFLDANTPKYIFVHHKRISFTDSKKTDSVEYAHFVWVKGENPKSSELILI
jgi:hypothetical protein